MLAIEDISLAKGYLDNEDAKRDSESDNDHTDEKRVSVIPKGK